MTLRPSAFVIGAIGALGLTTCDNSGIAGGGGGGAGGGVPSCVGTCDAAVTQGGTPCAGSGSFDAYNALVACGCGTNGACNSVCGANFCAQTAADPACNGCLQSSCGNQLMDCTAD
jgi:hypothetical protein